MTWFSTLIFASINTSLLAVCLPLFTTTTTTDKIHEIQTKSMMLVISRSTTTVIHRALIAY